MTDESNPSSPRPLSADQDRVDGGRPDAGVERDPQPDGSGEDVEGFSLEQLSAAYAQAARLHESGADSEAEAAESIETALRQGAASEQLSETSDDGESAGDDSLLSDLHEETGERATPEAIIEAALFVGHPENKPLTAARLASIMRDVSPDDVDAIIVSLNESYRQLRQGIRIAGDPEDGYRMIVAPEVESVRSAFSGKVRETRLNQPAIEVLSLVAYQPGITASEVSDRRGRDSASLLNQMVRRRLLEVKRHATEEATRPVAHYYPAERLLVLLGLDSIDDLPQVEEANL